VPDIDPFEGAPPLPKIVAVSLQQTGRLYNYLAGDRELRRGERVLVESEAGARVGTVEIEPHEPAQTIDLSALRLIIRIANDNDAYIEQENIAREAYARRMCVERIRERRVQMKMVSADYTFDARKVTFYFVAEGRVDFRELVRDLANTLRVRVEMKQIGARDETKVTGGVGPCGRELCCSSWLQEFQPVSVKMAKEQSLSLNPAKLAGMCGRLKCCLRYEYQTYVELRRALPAVGARVQSVNGEGVVVRHNVLRQTVVVRRAEDGVEVEATRDDLVAPRADA
jgi:cell fate regulator YaaT (PSP1 superfamily)